MITQTTKVDQLVEEILHIEPSLRSSREQVRAAVEVLLQLEPDLEPDAAFVSRLRTKLLLAEEKPRSYSFFSSFMNTQKTSMVLVPVLATLVVVVGIGAYYAKAPGSSSVEKNTRVAFVSVSPGAFGSLVGASGNSGALESASARDTSDVAVDPTVSPRPAMTGLVGAGGGSPSMAADKMIAPAIMYTYVYEGDDIAVPSADLPVFRRNKALNASGNSMFGTVSKLFPNINLRPLADARIQNINFVQDKKDGYTASVDFDDARVSIGPNYTKWYGADVCGPTPCNQNPLTESDVPADAELIRLANAFMEEYDINRELYGAPIVDTSWKDFPVGEGVRYIPDTVSVIYPLVLGEKQIMESYGTSPYGIRVNVDIRKNKVQGAWNISGGTYESSKYILETDAIRLKKFAENGGYIGSGPIFYDGMDITKKTLRLGTPTIVYEQQYIYSDTNQTSQELYVPALSFPLLNSNEAEGYVQQFVRVPLPKEILDARENPTPPNGGPIMLLREAQ